MRVLASNLEELTLRARYELECLGYPAHEWVPRTEHAGEHVCDVVIVGGGQSGVSIAFGLMRERVTNVVVVDRNPEGLEGPWMTFARMHTLRTPKSVTGPDLGIASLSARAWYEAQYGQGAWQRLERIPRELWQAYIMWVRRTVGVSVRNDTEAFDIEPLNDGLFAVHVCNLAAEGRPAGRLIARNVVLATGIEGSGSWAVPGMISAGLPRSHYAHTSDPIAFDALAKKRVAVLGAGASAFDNAAMALEHGAASVDLFARRRELPSVNPNRWMEFAGFMRHFGELDDATKWRFMRLIFGMNQPPPRDTFERCAVFGNFRIHLASPFEGIAFERGCIRATTPKKVVHADFLIVGTGFRIDFSTRPELRRMAHAIARWQDRHYPPAEEMDSTLATYPYLSGNFQFTEKTPGEAPYLRNVFCYTFAAMPSLAGSAGISALKFGVDRIVRGITRELFVRDAAHHLQSLRSYAEKELDLTSLALEQKNVISTGA